MDSPEWEAEEFPLHGNDGEMRTPEVDGCGPIAIRTLLEDYEKDI